MSHLLETIQRDELINEDQVRVLRIESKRSGKPILRLLVDTELVSPAVINQYQADTVGLALDPDSFVPDARALSLLDEKLARQYNVLPITFDQSQKLLVLAIDDSSNLIVRDRLRREVVDSIELSYRRVEATEIKRTLDKCYGVCHSLTGILEELEQNVSNTKLENSVEHAPVVRLVDAILQDAVTRRASDIHLSPEGLFVSIRYRVDGVLITACCLHVCFWPAMLVRIKVLSEIDIAETRLPQDGHVARTIHGQRIDFRVASFPTRCGESLVLRVLDRRRGIRTLSSLCNDTETEKSLVQMVQRPSGLVVVCGPTGSGKTTTLYALLQSLDESSLNIMTLEDPVEYPLANIRQTRVRANAAFGFGDGVRGVLRQDPDVILIGEIRDKDSCLMACRAAMTGHLVLTSTHANDCIGAVSRLLELGAQRSVLATVLTGIVSQRLLRKRCAHCKEPDDHCGVCRGVGYSGRIPLFESVHISSKLAALLSENAAVEALREQAEKDGTISLKDSAFEQVRKGLTNALEVERVLGV